MAIFGDNVQESQYVGLQSGLIGSEFSLTEAGTIQSITAYLGQDSGSGSVMFLLYRASDSVLVGQTAVTALAAAPTYQWKTINLVTPYVATAGDYVIGMWANTTAGYTYYLTTAGSLATWATPGSWPTPTSPFAGSTAGTGRVSIYATYTASVTTTTPSNITPSTASGGGYVTSDGGGTVTAYGVCWSTSSNPTTLNSHTTDGSGTGPYSSNITGLAPSTVYHVRAYATNSSGTAYGADVQFNSGLVQVINEGVGIDEGPFSYKEVPIGISTSLTDRDGMFLGLGNQ